MNKISLVINTLNEAANIADCILSAKPISDEIIVCDMYSDDNTVEIAKSHNAIVVYHNRTGFVEPARYFAISQASAEWVLVLDADERLTYQLGERLKKIVEDDSYELVSIPRLDEYFGDFLIDGSFDKKRYPRFFKKKLYMSQYESDETNIHQNFRIIEFKAKRKIALSSDYHIIHFAYPTIEKYAVKTIGSYARIEAEQMYTNGISFSKKQLILDPLKNFLRNYFINGGYLGGTRGFIKHFLHSVYRFNVWANIWLCEENHKVMNS